MRRRSVVLFALLLVFWLVVSSSGDRQHLMVGALLALITFWFWHDLGLKLPRIVSIGELLRLGYCLFLLALSVIQSNIIVAKTLLFSSPPVSPVFLIMEPPIKSNWGRILLATFITITPGTVTIDVDPETGRFIVHALADEIAIGLLYWRMIHEIENLEKYRQRRMKHVVDTGRTYGSDSLSIVAGDHRADSH